MSALTPAIPERSRVTLAETAADVLLKAPFAQLAAKVVSR